jgi:DNA-binding NarL/FixJ family response regulator
VASPQRLQGSFRTTSVARPTFSGYHLGDHGGKDTLERLNDTEQRLSVADQGGIEIAGAVLIADPDVEARQQLARVLTDAGFQVVQASDGSEALTTARQIWPIAVILEIPLGTLCGYEVCRTLKSELGPELVVIFLSGARTEPYDRVAGLLVGADDYVTKPSAPDEVLARLRIATRRSAPEPATAANTHLTRREHEVLNLLAEGLKWVQIAERLVISPKTVATHVGNIRRKLGVTSRAEAIAVAYRDQLLDPPGPFSPRPVTTLATGRVERSR